MLIAGYIRRGLAATLAVLMAAAAAAATPPPGGEPDPADVVAAYLTLAGWVRSFDPPDPDSEAAELPIRHATAVALLLRHRGRVLGSAVDARGGPLMVRRAAGRALSQVRGDRTIAALPEDVRDGVGRTLTVELEVAGSFIPLPGRTFAEIAEQIEPGLDGLAMRREETLHVVFPAQMRAANTCADIERLLPSLAVELSLPAQPLAELRRRFGVQTYRFRTIHLTQRAPGRRPFETIRGHVLIPVSAVTEDEVKAFADGLVNHLITSMWARDQPLGVMGGYRLVTDTYAPPVAPPRDQALVAYALARFAAIPQASDDTRVRCTMAADVILQELAAVVEGEDDPLADPVACAAVVLAASAIREAGAVPQPPAFVHAARARVVEAVVFFAGERESAVSKLPPHAGALLAAAAGRLLRDETSGTDADSRIDGASGIDVGAVRTVVERVWASVPPARRITLLPWIAWAWDDVAEVTGDDASSSALGRQIEVLDEIRIGDSPDMPADLLGGFALRRNGRPAADAQTARPAAFLGRALRQPGLTSPQTVSQALEGHRRTMRFLRQLAVDDTMLWSTKGPLRAKGGLRASGWDSDQPTAAQVMGLLAASETLISLDALQRSWE